MPSMADYRRNNRTGGNRSFGKPRFNREQREMFSATCANCGKQCEVPFRPTGDKPVLCRDCFQESRGSDSRRSGERSFDKPRFERDSRPDYQAQFDALNRKLDKILNLLTEEPESKSEITEKE